MNEVNRKKSTPRIKLKATGQEKRLLKWKEHFKCLLSNPPEITDKPTPKTDSQLDVKLG